MIAVSLKTVPAKYVAFFRNLNLGHRGSPTGDELVAAFGTNAAAANFQTNGTVLFTSSDPLATAVLARGHLRELGFEHAMVVRTHPEIRRIVETTPDAHPGENVYRTTVSLFDVERLPEIQIPLRSSSGLVELRHLELIYAAAACWQSGNSVGDVTGMLEKLLETPVTTRTIGTMRRLLAKIEKVSP